MNNPELTAHVQHMKDDIAMKAEARRQADERLRRIDALSKRKLGTYARSLYERGVQLGDAIFAASDVPNGKLENVSREARRLELPMGDFLMYGKDLGLMYYYVRLDTETGTGGTVDLGLVQVFMAETIGSRYVAEREGQLETFQTIYDATGLPAL